jgi:hypothetical protein
MILSATGGIVHWQRTFLGCTRPWVPSLAQKKTVTCKIEAGSVAQGQSLTYHARPGQDPQYPNKIKRGLNMEGTPGLAFALEEGIGTPESQRAAL